MFYTPKRKHDRNGMLSSVEFERQQKMKAEGAYKTRGCSLFAHMLSERSDSTDDDCAVPSTWSRLLSGLK
jgi:hypothetical protein